jgi:hypothetical protein
MPRACSPVTTTAAPHAYRWKAAVHGDGGESRTVYMHGTGRPGRPGTLAGRPTVVDGRLYIAPGRPVRQHAGRLTQKRAVQAARKNPWSTAGDLRLSRLSGDRVSSAIQRVSATDLIRSRTVRTCTRARVMRCANLSPRIHDDDDDDLLLFVSALAARQAGQSPIRPALSLLACTRA